MEVTDRLHRIVIAGVLALAVAAPALGAQSTGMGTQKGTGQRTGQTQQQHGQVPGVQLSAEQQRQIAAIRSETQRQVQSIRQDRSLTSQQRNQRIADAQRRGHERVLNVLTPEQRQRFAQKHQERGRVAGYRGGGQAGAMPGATSTAVPGVQLTQQQQQRVVAIRRDLQTEIQAIHSNSNLSTEQKDARIAEAQRKAHDQVMNVLTPQQREQFRQRWQGRQPGS